MDSSETPVPIQDARCLKVKIVKWYYFIVTYTSKKQYSSLSKSIKLCGQ